MARAAKKQRTSNGDITSSQAALALSTQHKIEGKVQIATNEKQIDEMLRKLRTSKSVKEAMQAMKDLHGEIRCRDNDTDDIRRKDAARKIVRFEGIGTIHSALILWHAQSTEFSELSMRFFVDLTFLLDHHASLSMVRVGGIRTILATVMQQSTVDVVGHHAVGLFSNLSLIKEKDTKKELAEEVCIDTVIRMMHNYPKNLYTQRCGCQYFSRICDIDGTKEKLRSKQVLVLVATSLTQFFYSDELHAEAKRAMDVMMTK